MPYLRELNLSCSTVDDLDMCGIAEFTPQLEVLDLVDTQVKFTHWLLPVQERPADPDEVWPAARRWVGGVGPAHGLCRPGDSSGRCTAIGSSMRTTATSACSGPSRRGRSGLPRRISSSSPRRWAASPQVRVGP